MRRGTGRERRDNCRHSDRSGRCPGRLVEDRDRDLPWDRLEDRRQQVLPWDRLEDHRQQDLPWAPLVCISPLTPQEGHPKGLTEDHPVVLLQEWDLLDSVAPPMDHPMNHPMDRLGDRLVDLRLEWPLHRSTGWHR